MANPNVVDLVAGTWTKVATNVNSGYVWITNTGTAYYYSYRLTGQIAPVGLDDMVQFIPPGMPIAANDPIDVYIRSDSAGQVRFDS